MLYRQGHCSLFTDKKLYENELISLVKGYLFINHFNSFYKIDENEREIPVSSNDLIFPHISVNIGYFKSSNIFYL